ncbi:MAG: hypothetical protein A2287_07895 [Candidatus Melainabacteria bacterium RIFOXYA12_FULL_32_12]|nr:MAG: hypothetical protein A2255_08490 [Candidatus Melainabacteria bacterium RIFOXYA2_FULL_32_9]OGI31833.1 MAG: hypothetical protein A2287_07895 [Candidatus Melainabacteria bacterium RIFOXYA12_FULL_32_12]
MTFHFRTDSSFFLREVSERKLRRLAELAHQDPLPLVNATENGFFNSIRQKAKDILKIERSRAKTENIRQCFHHAIKLLNENG